MTRLVLLGALALTGLAATGPRVVKDEAGFNRCADDEPPCPGRLLTIANPARRPVVVSVRCGRDPRTDVTVRVPARGRARVDVGVGRPLLAGACKPFRWWTP